MWKNRLGYILAFSGCMILLFAYSRPFMLYSVVLLMTLAVAMYLFLRRDIRSIETVLTIAPTVKEGQEVFLSVDISSEHFFHAAGYVMAELEIRNEMFDTVEHKKFLMSLSGRRNHFEIPAETDFCGETCIECQNIWIFDLFKLFRAGGKKPRAIRTVIYPETMDIRVELDKNMAGAPQEEGMIQKRKGNDLSEIFDIREYVPGDDIRSIHWKLSSKTDTLILKEASDPSHYNVVILPDFGRKQLGETVSAREVNAAVGIGVAVGQQFIMKGVPFCIAFPGPNGLHLTEIRNKSDYQKMLTQWLACRIQDNGGDGLKYLATGHMEKYFTRLLILSAGKYDQNLSLLDGKISITVLNAVQDSNTVNASKNGTCQIVEIPADNKKDTYRIIC